MTHQEITTLEIKISEDFKEYSSLTPERKTKFFKKYLSKLYLRDIWTGSINELGMN